MTKDSSERSQSVKLSQLKASDNILYQGKEALIVKISSWRDAVHGVVYGLDLVVKGKPVRVSFAEDTKVDLLN